MSDLLSSSRMDNGEYGMHSSTTTTTTTTSTHSLGLQRHSNQWTSSSSSSSPRISDMHSLLSMSFSPNDNYNSKDPCTSLDQQGSDEEKLRIDFDNGSNSAMVTSSGDTINTLNNYSSKQQSTVTKKKSKKSTQQRPQKQQTGKRRSPNAFFVFCSDRRQILKQGKPNARNTDINRQLGDDWKALPQEERDRYKREADRIRAELPNDNTSTHNTNTALLTNTDTPSITFTTMSTINDGSHSSSDHQGHQNHHLHNQQQPNLPPTFDLPFNDFAGSTSSGSRTNRDGSIAVTIAVDDESVTSDGTGSGDQQSKRGSLTNSDLSPSFSSPSSQHPLNVASVSGAAEANALDQASLAGYDTNNSSSSNNNNNNNSNNNNNNSSFVEEKTERLKRPPNAYLLFNREMRRKLLDQNENLTVALISKLISRSWHDLPQDTKDGYINAAAKLKQQHLEDHPNYVYSRRSRTELAQAGYRSRPSKKRKKTMDDTDQLNAPGTDANGNTATNKDTLGDDTNQTSDPASSSSLQNGTTGTLTATSTSKDGTKQQQRRFPDPRGRKKKKHKNPLGPKHPMSGFLFFASYARPEAVRQHPKSNVGMISKVIAEQWKKMTDQDKKPWVDKAQADKARYAKEMEDFNLAQERKEISERQQQQHKNEWMNHTTDGRNDSNHGYDALPMGQMKKSLASSTTAGSFKDEQHASETLTLANGKEALVPNGIHDHMDYHHLHQHHIDMDQHTRHHQRSNNNSSMHYNKHSYKPVSRLHSALASSRPASPTELDSQTIATVAQMVNPRNHSTASNGTCMVAATSSTAAIPTSVRERLHLSSTSLDQHPSGTPSLTSIMHHHDNSSVGNLQQLHVPATPPSPAIDTI
ncbi:unnamed protein product [Absidia cylindrospora]